VPKDSLDTLKTTNPILLAAAATGLLGLALVAAWNDVIPGGWRLRGIVWTEERRAAWVREDHAAERIELFRAERDAIAAGSIVFLGSSTIERFPLGEVFPTKPCVNRGVNGDTTLELRRRLDDSLPAAEPAALVVGIGGNDLRREQLVAALVRDRVVLLLDDLQRRYPDVPITLVGLFSATDAGERELYETSLFNTAVRREAVKRKIEFLDTRRAPLVGPEGRLQDEYAADRYHLNASGYALLGEWIVTSGGVAGRILAP